MPSVFDGVAVVVYLGAFWPAVVSVFDVLTAGYAMSFGYAETTVWPPNMVFVLTALTAQIYRQCVCYRRLTAWPSKFT